MLVQNNISVVAAIFLVQEYGNDLHWFIEELLGNIEKRKIYDQLEQADLLGAIQGLSFKKGKAIFTKWRGKKLMKLEEINDKINEDKLTIFEKLKRRNEPKTIFDTLIKYKGK